MVENILFFPNEQWQQFQCVEVAAEFPTGASHTMFKCDRYEYENV